MPRFRLYKNQTDFIHKWMERSFLLLLMTVWVFSVQAQEEKEPDKKRISSINKSASKLSKMLEENAPDEEVAFDYITLAKELTEKKEYIKAEDYLKRALNLYLKQKNDEMISLIYRELAKVQEIQAKRQDAKNKLDESIANYRKAALLSSDNILKQLNENDANRLMFSTDIAQQEFFVQDNINLATNSNSVPEQIAARRQMAEIKKIQNDNQGALKELERALDESTTQGEMEKVSFDIKQEIANTLSDDKKHVAAIELNKELVDEARLKKNPQTEVKQLKNLADSYFKAGKVSEGIIFLEEAYSIAIEKGLTLEARKVLEQIVEYYHKEHNTAQVLNAYSGFISQLETLVKNDSTLVDEKFFRLQEDKIMQLEKERALKDELISKQNRYNNVLWVSITLILISLIVISKVLYDNLRKNKRIALQSLRREMNPHFIFNSLNSVNQFIAENKELEANKYLSSYSKLMRTIMENSNKDFIALSTELEQLRKYLELEHLRFRDKFTYTIEVDQTLDTDSVMIPNMLIQPQLENAIWHGLRYKEGSGNLWLTIHAEGEEICITVEDNGIGLDQSIKLKTEHQKAHHSRGQSNTFERIHLLNHLYNTRITMDITDKKNDESGVVVTFRFPRINKKRMM